MGRVHRCWLGCKDAAVAVTYNIVRFVGGDRLREAVPNVARVKTGRNGIRFLGAADDVLYAASPGILHVAWREAPAHRGRDYEIITGTYSAQYDPIVLSGVANVKQNKDPYPTLWILESDEDDLPVAIVPVGRSLVRQVGAAIVVPTAEPEADPETP